MGSLLAVGYRRGIDGTVSDLSGQLRGSEGAGGAGGAADLGAADLGAADSAATDLGATDLGAADLGAAAESGVAGLTGLVESAQDSIGRALGAAQGLAEAGFGGLADRLIESAISAFNEGMTLGLGVIAGIVFLTSIVIGKFYPNEESESSADFGSARFGSAEAGRHQATGKHEGDKAETGKDAMLTAETQTADFAPKAVSEGDGGQR